MRRRWLVWLALLFALAQLLGVAGAVFGLPLIGRLAPGPAVVIGLMVADLVLMSVFAGWVVWGSVSTPLVRLSREVQRIADGDYHHRIGDTDRVEL